VEGVLKNIGDRRVRGEGDGPEVCPPREEEFGTVDASCESVRDDSAKDKMRIKTRMMEKGYAGNSWGEK